MTEGANLGDGFQSHQLRVNACDLLFLQFGGCDSAEGLDAGPVDELSLCINFWEDIQTCEERSAALEAVI